MKKTYIQPQTESIKINAMTLLAGSGGVGNGDAVGNSYDPDAKTYGRRGWFDDDDED